MAAMQDHDKLRPWLALVRATGIGPVAVSRLLQRFGSARAILDEAGNLGNFHSGSPRGFAFGSGRACVRALAFARAPGRGDFLRGEVMGAESAG